MSATTQPQDQQDRTAPLVCICGYRDPEYNGVPSRNWSKVDGRDVCPDCAWMQSGPDADVMRESARRDPRGLGDGLGS